MKILFQDILELWKRPLSAITQIELENLSVNTFKGRPVGNVVFQHYQQDKSVETKFLVLTCTLFFEVFQDFRC